MKIETHSCDDGKCLLCKQGVPRVGDLNAVRDVLELPATATVYQIVAEIKTLQARYEALQEEGT